MTVQRITSIEELQRFFDDNGWFELANCLILSPPPGGDALPEQIELMLRVDITGNAKAKVRVFEITRITASGVRKYAFNGEEFHHRTDHSVEIAELIKTSAGFGLGLDIPTFVWMVADTFTCERLPDVTEPMPPWASDSSVAITAPQAEAPSPSRWVTMLADQGVEVRWRAPGGDVRPADRVPADYTGWFLERSARLLDDDLGVFMREVTIGADGVSLVLDRMGVDGQLWLSVCRAVAHMLPDGEFDSGMWRFNAQEWLELLSADGEQHQHPEGLD